MVWLTVGLEVGDALRANVGEAVDEVVGDVRALMLCWWPATSSEVR